MSEVGDDILEAIVKSGGLFNCQCSENADHACIVIWSSGAAEQLEAIAYGAIRKAKKDDEE